VCVRFFFRKCLLSIDFCVFCTAEMVDWATQDRLYPAGYRSVDIRYRTINVDSSLPYSVSFNKSHIFFKYLTKMVK
jgi:hypothetical protein